MAQSRKNGQTPAQVAEEVKATASIMVGVPTALKELIDNAAKAADVSVAGWVRKHLADAFDFILPATVARGRVSKYAHITDPTARAAARANDAKAQQAQVRAVLNAIKAGKLNSVDINALVEEFGAPTRTRRSKEQIEAEARGEAVTA